MQTVFKYVKALLNPSTGTTTIEWRLSPVYQQRGDHLNFYVEWTYGGDTTWTRLNPTAPVVDQASYIDTGRYSWNVLSTVYYRVVLDDDGTDYPSVPVGLYGELSSRDRRLVYEIVRRKYVQLKKTTVGVPGVLLRRKESGLVCPCVDPDLNTTPSLSCDICWGVGLIGGYYDPLPYYMEFLQTSGVQFAKTAQQGVEKQTQVKTQGINYPTIAPEDLWVDLNTDDRYIITPEIKPAALIRGCPAVLEMTMTLLPTTQPEYRIPISASAATGSPGWTTGFDFVP